jgi:ABC-type transport system substrate-binding protein
MLHKRLMLALGVLAALGLVLSACQPQQVEVPVTVVIKETQAPLVQTQVIQQTLVVTEQAGAFTQPHPILSDVRVRRAMAYCTNKLDLIKSVYPLLDEESQQALVLDSFLPRFHWAYAGDENITLYPFDPAQGRALLDEAGWTLAEGATFRTNANGDELSVKFTTTTATFRQTWAAVFEQQMLNCGVRLLRFHVPAAWLFGDTTGLARRDYETAAYAYTGQPDPGGQTLFACDQIPLPENGWVGQNGTGWCNPVASDAIKQANNTLLREERTPAYRIVQQEYTNDVPSIPLFNRTDTYAISADLQGFAPAPGQQFVTYNANDWAMAGRDTVVYGFTQEPASMFTLVESGLTAVLANSLVQGQAWTSLNYDFKPLLLKQLPTLESGLASNDDVEVKEGDKVVDINGSVVELTPGVKVRNAAGEVVEYQGGAITMKQIVARFEYPGLVWSDGTPVSQADYELKWKIDCDRESGATSFITCDQTQNVEFLPNGYIQTTYPGVQAPLYFLSFDPNSLPDLYPAHRVLSDGRRLADVPASEWTTLPEIAETPIGVGPYIIKEWVKGEKMVFEANPYYFLGEPATKNLVVAFITPENSEAQLIGGQLDILDHSTLVGVTEALKNASDAGKITIIVDPSATWEHIDFNLFVP